MLFQVIHRTGLSQSGVGGPARAYYGARCARECVQTSAGTLPARDPKRAWARLPRGGKAAYRQDKQKDRPKAALYSNCKLGALVVRSPQRRIYFGRIVGSPPGLPGGGMTGILPVSGVGARISGSTPVGGQSTPSDLASLSLSGSARGSVVVVPCGAMVPCCGIDCVGAQPVAFLAGAGGAV